MAWEGRHRHLIPIEKGLCNPSPRYTAILRWQAKEKERKRLGGVGPAHIQADKAITYAYILRALRSDLLQINI